MKKNRHPHLTTTRIHFKDGSVYLKKWLFFRALLPLEADMSTHPLWKKQIKTTLVEKETSFSTDNK